MNMIEISWISIRIHQLFNDPLSFAMAVCCWRPSRNANCKIYLV